MTEPTPTAIAVPGPVPRYPRPLRILHWSLALLVAIQFALILVLHQLESLEFGQIVLTLHRECGSVVLLLILVRLALAFRLRRPPCLPSPRWQARIAHIVHVSLYAVLAAQPLLGILVAWSRGDDVFLLGLIKLPMLLQISTEQGVGLEAWHRWIAYGLLGLLAVHLGAVVFNQVVRKSAALARMLPKAPDRLDNRVPVLAQLCLGFGAIVALTLGAGVYGMHRYTAFSELRTRFDETEVAALDGMRTAQLAIKDAERAGTSRPHADLVMASRDGVETIGSFTPLLSDPGARKSAGSAAVLLGRIAAGDRSSALATAADTALQDAIDSQTMAVFQGRLAITQAAASGHDLIVLMLAPTVLLSLALALMMSHSILSGLLNARKMIRRVEQGLADGEIVVNGNGELARLMRDILRMRDAVATREAASHAGTAASQAKAAEVARLATAREGEVTRRQALEQAQIVEAVAAGLAALASGNLAYRIHHGFPGDYDRIRLDFNETIGQVEAVMQTISSSSGAIGGSSREVAQAANDLAARTERQSASLSEMTSTLARLTGRMKLSASGAAQVAHAVSEAHAVASGSDAIVGEAIGAMGDIAESAGRIFQILGVMDGIAAQSNFLALNAMVEAVRAGESSSGFAVVAQEIRGLSQQAAKAAKEVRELVQESNRQIGVGVALVEQTGSALRQIVRQAGDIDALVGGIAAAAQEQAGGIEEISHAMADMEHTVHDNALMVEETTAALLTIHDGAIALDGLIKRFGQDRRAHIRLVAVA